MLKYYLVFRDLLAKSLNSIQNKERVCAIFLNEFRRDLSKNIKTDVLSYGATCNFFHQNATKLLKL